MAEQLADLSKYSVLELFSSGSRFVGEYSEEDAVDQFLELHPNADRQQVETELQAELARRARAA